jgi:hypothetical protein
LGIGLTPAGDDLILGAMYAIWIIHPPGWAQLLARDVADEAAPLTTSLSAAWLKSAGRGEAGMLWHTFLDALDSYGTVKLQSAMNQIMSVGATSGTEALAGFLSTIRFYREMNLENVIS